MPSSRRARMSASDVTGSSGNLRWRLVDAKVKSMVSIAIAARI